MSNVLRKIIMQQLSHEHGDVSNIIYNSIQYDMEYNPSKDWFEIELKKLRTEYFHDNPNDRGGMIGANIHWEIVNNEKFIVSLIF